MPLPTNPQSWHCIDSDREPGYTQPHPYPQQKRAQPGEGTSLFPATCLDLDPALTSGAVDLCGERASNNHVREVLLGLGHGKVQQLSQAAHADARIELAHHQDVVLRHTQPAGVHSRETNAQYRCRYVPQKFGGSVYVP